MRKFILFILLLAPSIIFADVNQLETDEGLGLYRYLEEYSTTHVHYSTDTNAWNDALVWVDVNGSGANYQASYAHDGPPSKHLSTDNNLDSANHANWVEGALIDCYYKIQRADSSWFEGSDIDRWRIVEVSNIGAPTTNLQKLATNKLNLVMDFIIDAGVAETLTNFWIENTGTLQEVTHIGNGSVLLYYETVTGSEEYNGTESKATLWGDYGGNATGNEQWGHDALSISVPAAGLRCYIVISNLTGSYRGKTAKFKIMNDGISLNNGLMRIDEMLNSDTQTGTTNTYHTITIDGTLDFNNTTERILTTSASTGYTNWITWDDDYLYIGYDGDDIDVGTRKLVVYFSTNTNTGYAYGVKYSDQWPVLPFKADFVFNFLADWNWDSAEWNGSQWNWTGTEPFPMTSAVDIFRSSDYLEFRIAKTNLGSTPWLDVYVQFVGEDISRTYGAIPDDTLTDGNDSNPSRYISFRTDIWDYEIIVNSADYQTNDIVVPYTNAIIYPPNSESIRQGTVITISNYARDDNGLYKVEIYTNTGGLFTTFYNSNTNAWLTTNLTVNDLALGAHYFYSIAYDTTNKTVSKSNTITVDANTPPPDPKLTFPANNDTHFYMLKPRFKWTIQSDSDGDSITNFRIIVSKSADLSSPEFDEVFYTTETNFLTYVSNYLTNTTYYWSVRANDGIEWGDWSDTNTFTIDPLYITLDGSISEWGNPPAGDDTDIITNGQWIWKDKTSDHKSDLAPPEHLDIDRFGITSDTNGLYLMFRVPAGYASSPRTYVSLAIDTNFDANGNTANVQADCSVSADAKWEFEIIANVDGTGYYTTTSTNSWFECGENWITPEVVGTGFGEILIPWFELGYSQVPEKLRMTVNIGRVVDGQYVWFLQDNAAGSDFMDCISTNTGGTTGEMSDADNDTYFDLNFETNGRVIANNFIVSAPTTALSGVPFAVVVTAKTFLGGDVQDFDRDIIAESTSNGNAFIISNSGWVNGVATNYIVLNAVGTNGIKIMDKIYTNIYGISSGVVIVSLPDLHINEVFYDPNGPDTSGEWVELFNKSSGNIHLSNWAIHDQDGVTPLYVIAQSVVLPSSNYLVLYDGAGSDDVDFSDGRGILYGDWGTADRLDNTLDEVGVYCYSGKLDRYTMIDFMAYGGNSGTDDNEAVAAGLWSSGDFATIATYTAGSSLILLPDGDDTDAGNDWEVDHSPTRMYGNFYLVAENVTITEHSANGYRGSIMLTLEAIIPDPENDSASTGDAISNIIIGLGATIQSSDIIEASLWNDNGAGQFNYGYVNNDKTNNLLMATGYYSNAINSFVFTNLANSTITNADSGGSIKIYFALKIQTNATIGREINPHIRMDSVVMKSSYPDAVGLVDMPVSNNQKMSIDSGYFIVNEYTDAYWKTADSPQEWQFIEIYNNSTASIDPEGWNISTRRGNDVLLIQYGSTFAGGSLMLACGGGATFTAFTNNYNENTNSTIVVTETGTHLGDFGFTLVDPPFILRANDTTILAIVDYTNSYSQYTNTVERISPLSYGDTSSYFESSSITNGTPGYWNGFRAIEMNLSDVSNYALDADSQTNLVLDFYIPNNNGAEDTLSLITIHNNGTAINTDVSFKLYREDGTTSGVDNDDDEIGSFVYQGSSRWEWSGSTVISNAGSVDVWRFYITADVPGTTTDGRTVRLEIEQLIPEFQGPYVGDFANGAKVVSYNDGPVDGIVSNESIQTCGLGALSLQKTVESVELGGDSLTMAIPGALVTYKLTYSSLSNGGSRNVVLYDEIPDNTSYYTNYLGTATGWEVQFSINVNPDQSYGSGDYGSGSANARWIRWRKYRVTPDEDNRTMFVGVVVN